MWLAVPDMLAWGPEMPGVPSEIRSQRLARVGEDRQLAVLAGNRQRIPALREEKGDGEGSLAIGS